MRWKQAYAKLLICAQAASPARDYQPRATGWLGQRFNPAAPVTAAGEADRVSTLVALQAESGWLAKVTGAWQAAKISNLDYLLYCNLAAGRSFNDLTQVSGSAAEAPSTTFSSLELSAATVSPLTVAGAPRHFLKASAD